MPLLILACHKTDARHWVKFARGVCLVFKTFVVPCSIIILSSSSYGMPHNLEITLPQFQSINQFSKDVKIPSSEGHLVVYKYAQEVQISRKKV